MISTQLLKTAAALAVGSCAVVRAVVLDFPITVRNSYAVVDLEIGTPPLKYSLRFDAGSSSTWVTAKDCGGPSCQNFSGYNRTGYSPSASSTSETPGPYNSVSYLGGSLGGIATDDIFTVSTDDGPISWNQSFSVVNVSSWAQLPADGFMGLAFTSIASPNTTVITEQLIWDGLVDEPRVGIYYNNLNVTSDNLQGKLTLGGSREDIYVNGSMQYIPLVPSDPYLLWTVTLKSISGTKSVGNSSITTKSGIFGSATIDTGAGLVEVPDNYIDDIYRSIGMNWSAIINDHYIPKCVDFNSSWSVTFEFSDTTLTQTVPITLTGEDLIKPGFENGDPTTCWPPFINSGLGAGRALLGTPLLSKFYTVLDYGGLTVDTYQPRVGFGLLKDEYKS